MATDYGYGVHQTGRPLSFEDYQNLLKQGQSWVANAQKNDPAFQAWQRQASSMTPDMGAAPAWEGKDYWAEWRKTLNPAVASDFNRHMRDSTDWGDSVGKVMKVAVPALVAGAGLAGTGLFGTGLQSAVGGAPLNSAASAAGAVGESAAGAGIFNNPAYVSIPTSGVPGASEAAQAIYAAGGSGTSTGQALLNEYINSGTITGGSSSGGSTPGGSTPSGSTGGASGASGGLLNTVTNGVSGLLNNRGLISLIGGAVAGLTTDDDDGTTQTNYPRQPGLNIGTLQKPTLNQSAGTLTRTRAPMLDNSGLRRFGATGGTYTPAEYIPPIYRWGR